MPKPKPARPPSSARPSTSVAPPGTATSLFLVHGGRTAYGGHVAGTSYEEEYGYYEDEEEEEEESDDDDVFAFLPPTTAEQEEERRAMEAAQAQAQQQQKATSSTTTGPSPYGALGGKGQQSSAAVAAALQSQYYPATHTRTLPPQAEFAHSPFSFSSPSHLAPSPPTPTANSNNPYNSTFAYGYGSSYDYEYNSYDYDEPPRPTTAAGRTLMQGQGQATTTAQEKQVSQPSLVSAPSFSFSIASIDNGGGLSSSVVSAASANGGALAPALPITLSNSNSNANAATTHTTTTTAKGTGTIQYPDPTFDPWGRQVPSTSAGSNSNNPYFVNTNTNKNNPYHNVPSTPSASTPTAIRPSTSFSYSSTNPYARFSAYPGGAPPLSPPSPSTDSHPSTSAGLSTLGNGNEYKLRKMGASAPAGTEGSGLREEVEREEEEEREESVEEAVRGGRKEVRVNLPGVGGSRSSADRRSQSQVNRKSTVEENKENANISINTAVDMKEDPSLSPTTTLAPAAQTMRKRGSKRYSAAAAGAMPGTPNTSYTYGYGYSTTISPGHVPRHRNPNAQPYAAYADLARESGYPIPSLNNAAAGGAAQGGGDGAVLPNTASSLGGSNAHGITKERRRRKQRRRASRKGGDVNSVDLEHGDVDAASSIVKGGVVSYEAYDYHGGKRGKDADSVLTGTSASFRSASPTPSRSFSRERRRRHRRSYSGSRSRSYSRSRASGFSGDGDWDESYDDHAHTRRRYGGAEDDQEGSDGSESEESIKMEFDFDAIEEEDSPFPEVRASVSNIDDPDMPAMTIRMWFVGLILCMTSSALNVFFNFRSPAPTIVPLALLLVSYPFGKFLAFTLPITSYRIPLPHLPRFILPIHQPSFAPFRLIVNLLLPLTFPRSLEFSLNPGPWNIKEHVLVFIMANVSTGNPYALNAIVVSEVFYDIKLGYWFALTLVLATQLTGFGLAGLCRRFLVWPASMVWPQNLVACTLLNTLHAEDEDDGIGMYGLMEGGKGMSRYKFFIIATIASFVFFFLPGYLFEALSVFSFVCWAAPNNVPVNQLFGVRSGLGMSVLTFDWTQISWIGSPLMVPWWAEVHIFIGFILFYWIMTPILYYTNSWNLAYFPISANEPYDRFGQVYDVARVLRTNDTFDEAAYNAYSPLYLPATYAVTYLLAFALSTCVIVHTLLYHGRTLLNGIKKIRVEADDIHAKLMRNYPEVPDWWYGMAVAMFFALAVVAVEVWDTNVPVWALLLSVLLPVVYILPSGFIYAMTGQGITLNILAQIIPGTLLPGNPLANMVFKAYSVQTLSAGTSFVQDLKLGHYVKVPPRATFMVQMVATVIAAFIQVGTKEWIFGNVKDICQPNQPSQLTCPHNQVFFTASAVWGLIGPTRQFGTGTIYHPHLYAIIVGALLPFPFYLWQRRYPKSWVRYVSTPVVLNGVSFIPPATGINYSSWFAVGFVFQYIIRKRNFAWWSKFNYVLTSALDSGTVISVMLIFFTLQFPRQGSIQVNWWGNTVQTQTADWNRKPFLPIPEGGVVWKGFTPTPLPTQTPS